MDNKIMEVNEMIKLLEGSIIPLMAEMIKAMGEHSHRYENYIKEVKDKVEGVESSVIEEKHSKEEILEGIRNVSDFTGKLYSKSIGQEEAFGILTKTITTFGEKLTDLIDTNNQLVNFQHLQIGKMDEVISAFEENTARLDTLTLAVEGKINEDLADNEFQLNHPLFRDVSERSIIGPLEQPTDLKHIEQPSEPIHKVLENEIQRLKNSTKG